MRTPAGGQPATIDYTLDPAGNRTQVSGDTSDAGNYTLYGPAAPADAQVNQYSRTPWDRRQYDANGNP